MRWLWRIAIADPVAALRALLRGDDLRLAPQDRLGSDLGHVAGPVLATLALGLPAGAAVGAVMIGKQAPDGFRPGHGRRGDALLDAALAACGLALSAILAHRLGVGWLDAAPLGWDVAASGAAVGWGVLSLRGRQLQGLDRAINGPPSAG